MCGMAGYAGPFLAGLAARMNAAQAHRGPDGQGVFEDPAAAAQPMHSANRYFVFTIFEDQSQA